MKIVGIICEYNPFHNGHLHHLQKAKEIADGGIVICILTGYFSMRGDISVINKLDKIKCALNYGADITIELPFVLGTQNADIFAHNAVKLLSLMGVNTIVAGSEKNDLDFIKNISQLTDSFDFNQKIKENLDKGFSYRKSFSETLKVHNYEINSNDLLNLKYYEAIKKINPSIKLQLIQRINNNYNDKELNETSIQSATAIRNTKDIKNYVPQEINHVFETKGFYDINQFSQILKHLIITLELKNIFEVKEGIENYLKTEFDTIDNLIENLTTKRYTSSRIKRLISYIITNTTKDININNNNVVRVTGFNEIGQRYLSSIKKKTYFFTRIINGINHVYDKELQIAKIFSNVFKEDFIKMEQSLPYQKK